MLHFWGLPQPGSLGGQAGSQARAQAGRGAGPGQGPGPSLGPAAQAGAKAGRCLSAQITPVAKKMQCYKHECDIRIVQDVGQHRDALFRLSLISICEINQCGTLRWHIVTQMWTTWTHRNDTTRIYKNTFLQIHVCTALVLHVKTGKSTLDNEILGQGTQIFLIFVLFFPSYARGKGKVIFLSIFGLSIFCVF